MNNESIDQNDFLKNHMPYELQEEKWEALQQRIKTKVITTKTAPQTKVLPLWKRAAPIAAAVLLPLLATIWSVRQHYPSAVHSQASQLDAIDIKMKQTMDELNDQEIEYLYQINENQLSTIAE